ncbi:MAG: hypothetical protein HQ517_11970 [SAR324 cluster bacterium]|nr:hypothetical protein [SAR324 cluster bacterium]
MPLAIRFVRLHKILTLNNQILELIDGIGDKLRSSCACDNYMRISGSWEVWQKRLVDHESENSSTGTFGCFYPST